VTEYTPDAWVILRIETDGEILHKVMGGWYGGFAGADSWRVNSGIERVEPVGQGYRIHGYSGSIYLVHEVSQRATMLMSGVIKSLQERAEGNGHSVCVVDISEVAP
jgi:hypothetical protein